jgi:hypothetical protein
LLSMGLLILGTGIHNVEWGASVKQARLWPSEVLSYVTLMRPLKFKIKTVNLTEVR